MTTAPRSSALAFGALGIAGLIYGYNWVVMKTALQYSDPAVFAALRRSMRPVNPVLTLVVGLFGMTGATGLSIWALETGGAGKTSVLVYTMPMWLLLMSRVILGERIRGLQWLSVGLALAGLVFILSPWSAEGTPMSTVLGVPQASVRLRARSLPRSSAGTARWISWG